MIPDTITTAMPKCESCRWSLAFTWGHSPQHWRAFCSNPNCRVTCVMPHTLALPE